MPSRRYLKICIKVAKRRFLRLGLDTYLQMTQAFIGRFGGSWRFELCFFGELEA